MGDYQTVQAATMFAAGAHFAHDQRRKFTGEDYIVHPLEVMSILETVSGTTQEMLMAAALHDVVEDTKVRPDVIESLFGVEVARLVKQVTDVAKPEDGNRAARAKINREHLAMAWPEAKTIKLADIIANSQNMIVTADNSFALMWLNEKKETLEVLRQGHPDLYAIATALVEEQLNSLKEDFK